MRDADVLPLLRNAAAAVKESLDGQPGRGLSGARPTQYHLDVAADRAACEVLWAGGVQVVSEESGRTGEGDVVVVVDPIDGSTNCDRGIPFFATSLAAIRNGELIAGLVVNLATGIEFWAERGHGAFRAGDRIRPRTTSAIEHAIISFSGYPDRHVGWQQYRALGAASLEGCLVADGSLDAFVVTARGVLHPWDYLAALLIAREAGVVVTDRDDAELVITEPHTRRPIFAATPDLSASLRSLGPV